MLNEWTSKGCVKELMNAWLCGGVQGSIKRIQFVNNTAREGVTGVYKSCWKLDLNRS